MIIKLHGKNVNVQLTSYEIITELCCLHFIGFIDHAKMEHVKQLLTKQADSLIIHANAHSVAELLYFEMIWEPASEDQDGQI